MVLERAVITRAVLVTIAFRLGEELVGHRVEDSVAYLPTGRHGCRCLIVAGISEHAPVKIIANINYASLAISNLPGYSAPRFLTNKPEDIRLVVAVYSRCGGIAARLT